MENLHPLLDTEINIVMENKEKAEVLNAFIASIFNSKTSCSQGTQPPELEEVAGEQNEGAIIQGKKVSNLLYHLHTHRCRALMGSTAQHQEKWWKRSPNHFQAFTRDPS